MHFIARGRGALDAWFVYAGLLLFGPYVALALTLGGLLEPALKLRRRFGASPPPQPEHRNPSNNGATACRSFFWSASAASARWATWSTSRTATRATSCCRRRRRCARRPRTCARFEKDRAQLEARDLELKKEAEAVAAKLDGKTFLAIRQAGDTGQLYGSVTPRDIAELVTAGGFTVDRRQIVLDRPIKTLGLHPTRVALHPEVIVQVTLNVARSEDEAERQARGEDVTVVKEEARPARDLQPRRAVRGRGPGPPARRGQEEPDVPRQGLSAAVSAGGMQPAAAPALAPAAGCHCAACEVAGCIIKQA